MAQEEFMTKREFAHEYLITSDRASRRNDEYENLLRSYKVLEVGQRIDLDGLGWTVVKVIK